MKKGDRVKFTVSETGTGLLCGIGGVYDCRKCRFLKECQKQANEKVENA